MKTSSVHNKVSFLTFEEAYNNLVIALKKIHSEGEAKSISKILFEDLFKIYALDYQKMITTNEQERLAKAEIRLLKNEPIQYILGQADFYGLKFNVNPGVLIPRSETEELVYWILESNASPKLSVLDIGTGSGCIPITLKKKQPTWNIYASDISAKAIEIARTNANLNNVEIEFLKFNILDESKWNFEQEFDIIISNPPYIPENEKHLMPANVLENEPHLALFVKNENPLIFYDVISEFALQNLNKKGFLYFEMNEFNASSVKELMISKGFKNVEIQKDIYGKDRMIRGVKN